MDNRTGLAVNANHVITERDVEKKFKNISGSGFEILIEQSNTRHQEFSSVIVNTQSFESDAKKYYSNQVLQKKLLQGLASEFKIADQKDALIFLQQSHDTEHAQLLQAIEKAQDECKAKIKQDLMLNNNAFSSIERMREPLVERVNKLKNALIDTLILAAKDYQNYLKENKEWDEKKFIEFTDKFGCVTRIDRKNTDGLDDTLGYGLKFGHKIREDHQLPGVMPSLDKLRQCSLGEIVTMVNDVITECAYYSRDSYYSLKIIKKQFDDLALTWRGYFQLESEGRFSKQLKSLKLVQSEYEIINNPMMVIETEFKRTMLQQDSMLLDEIKKSLDQLQAQSDIEKKNIDEYTRLIKQELFVAVSLLSGPAEKCYRQIAVRNANMKIFNAEARTHGIAQIAALHRVQVAYEDGIRMAKQRDKQEYERCEKQTVQAMQEAEQAMSIAKARLESLQKTEKCNRKDLNYAKEYYDGACHRIYEAQLARECKKYEKRKTSYIEGQKEYSDVRILPKALKAYGEIVYQCAEIQAGVEVIHQILKDIPTTAESMWVTYHDSVAQAKELKNEFDEQKQNIGRRLQGLSEDLAKSAEKIASITALRESAESKLKEIKKDFPIEICEDHQETFDLANMRYADILKQNNTAQSVLLSVKAMPEAMVEYTGIISRCVVVEKKMTEAKQAAVEVKNSVVALEKMRDEASRLAQVGVVKNNLKEMALQKHEKAKEALAFATIKLKEAEEIRLAEEKNLSQAKISFTSEMHAKPQAIFDELNSAFSDIVVAKNTAEVAFASVAMLPQQLNTILHEAKTIENQKHMAGEIRQLMLDTILNNLHLWHIGKWGGGVNYCYNGKTFRIPHGVLNLITTLSTVTDYKECLAKVSGMAREREEVGRTQWKYRFFNIRDDATTGVLYHAIQTIKSVENLTENNIESLQRELQKIKGLRLEINHPAIRHAR